ncbi:MAG: CsbD family protein [Acidobacteriota bacterium]|nr:CsbD family protein [Acidobacteriota bacterium]
MNNDQVSGTVDQAKGKVKEQWGKLTDDPATQGSGLVDQAKGKVERIQGDAKEEVKDEIDKS